MSGVKESLTRAVGKALKNGWDGSGFASGAVRWEVVKELFLFQRPDRAPEYSLKFIYSEPSALDEEVELESYRTVRLDKNVLFDLGFAKALWGEGWHFNYGEKTKTKLECTDCGRGLRGWCIDKPNPYHDWWIHCYQWHLQQMVISENPFEYLELYA